MADLNVLIRERINLEGTERGTDYNLTLTEVNYIDNRIINCPSGSFTTLLLFDQNVGAGTFITTSVKYLRITNHSSTTSCILKTENDEDEVMSYQLAPKGSYLLSDLGMVSTDSNLIIGDYIKSLKIRPASGNADIEYFIATT
jgi:hypothetical protein